MEKYEEGPFKLLKRLLSLIGSSIHYETKRSQLFYLFRFLCLIMYMVDAFFCVIIQREEWTNVIDLCQAMVGCTVCVNIIVKEAFMWIRRDRLRELIRGMEEAWREGKGEEVRLLRGKSKVANLGSIGFSIVLVLLLTVQWGSSFYQWVAYSTTRLPFGYWYLVDPSKHYLTALSIRILSQVSSFLSLTTAYIIMFSFTMQISGNLMILKQRLTDLRFLVQTKQPQAVVKSEIQSCIDLHSRIISWVQMMNDLVSVGIFTELINASVLSCMCGYLTVKGSVTGASAMFLTTLLVPFVLCWCGNEIEEKSLDVFRASHNSGWEETPPNLRRYILMFMTQASKPLALKLTRNLVLNYKQYSNFLQASYTYFTVIYKLIE